MYISKYICTHDYHAHVHNYLACILNYLACIHNYLACMYNNFACMHTHLAYIHYLLACLHIYLACLHHLAPKGSLEHTLGCKIVVKCDTFQILGADHRRSLPIYNAFYSVLPQSFSFHMERERLWPQRIKGVAY